MGTSLPRIISLDHATVPSIDLLADFKFYQKYMGADFQKKGPPMVNFSIVRQKEGRAQIFFLEISGISGFGLFLQSEYPPKALTMLEGPRYGFAVVDTDLKSTASILRENGIEFLGPITLEPESPFKETIYLKDPSGNSLEFSIWRNRAPQPVGKQGLIPLAGMCQVAVDTLDLAQAEDFYEKALGMEVLYRSRDIDGKAKTVLRVQSGQIFTLQGVKEISERSVKRYKSDPHFAVVSSDSDWDIIRREIEARGLTLLPDYIASDGTRPVDEKNVYVRDPYGNNVQIFTRHANN